MVDHNLIADIGIDSDDIDAMILASLGAEVAGGNMDALISSDIQQFIPGNMLKGKIVGKAGDDAVIDVGLKSEGLIHKSEFDDWDTLESGVEIEVILEDLEDENGIIKLSKRKADRIRNWEKVLETYNEGDIVEGKGIRRIKGGILVDIGVPAFLPASQIDVRRPGDVNEFIGKTIRAEILKIDEPRRNIVISRRTLIENERDEAKQRLLNKISEGDIIVGKVTNVAEFGAFIDLGGIDGLLHVTDMSWGRIKHPSDMCKTGDELEVKVLKVDFDTEKIALGLKQKDVSPWDDIESRFPIQARVTGKVVNLVSYGAFVHLEDGVEGLVHVSEMSWRKRINHPSEVVSPGDEIEVVVLDIDKDKHEISLGMKQIESNPWEIVAEKYPIGTIVSGAVRNLTNYGAFVEIEPGIDGLLHVSDISWTEKIAHPNEKYKKNDEVECMVLEIDQEKQRISLGIKQMHEDPWQNAIPEAYKPGMVVHGIVTKITNFGVFVELEDGLEGLLHISELADKKVDSPQDIVKAGEEVNVKILRVDLEDRKIGLSLKRALSGEEVEENWESHVPKGDTPARGGMDDHGALGTDKIEL
ncbi:MAG TPA: 30S ribosomal protein S1 [Phycisphaerales bacterium]|nr:30S ribosomal protein S1 [Phycisphaerales bacterium]HIB00974.1 30S ribosomal protein S1 [Phycisphaerales bacterium]HIB51495.1 30S ribosomal protein S1 [Phycisphaerales bacterium]HIN83757.1 30S ribosomal protein S1 [Phycisphaerales bacterium]HIO19909.1 30S ribosomal protein S1 [Phycisphaerales bacterium]